MLINKTTSVLKLKYRNTTFQGSNMAPNTKKI